MRVDPPVQAEKLPALIAPPRTALLVIDVQEDFVSPAGAPGRWGVDLSILEPALTNVESLISCAHTKGIAVVFARVVTRPETDSSALLHLHQRKGRPPQAAAICRAGTSGADYHRVKPAPGDIEIEKTLYSCFAGTDLDAQLKTRGIDTLVIVGFTTDCCVDCTARDAFHRNYDVFVVSDACAAYETDLHLGALAGLSKNCALLAETNAVLSAWS